MRQRMVQQMAKFWTTGEQVLAVTDSGIETGCQFIPWADL